VREGKKEIERKREKGKERERESRRKKGKKKKWAYITLPSFLSALKPVCAEI
jgi:predicted transposase YdaD